jgi:hypothetical protein
LLSRGAIITGLLWGSILAFLIDQDLRRATLFGLLASCFALVGLIHAEQIGFSLSPITIGYLVLTALWGLLYFVRQVRGKAGASEPLDVAYRVVGEEKVRDPTAASIRHMVKWVCCDVGDWGKIGPGDNVRISGRA